MFYILLADLAQETTCAKTNILHNCFTDTSIAN